MITNATLKQIDTPSGVVQGGSVSFTSAYFAARCTLVSPTFTMQTTAAANGITVNAQLAVLVATIAGSTPVAGGRVKASIDGTAVETWYWIRFVGRNEKSGGLSHWLLGLERE